MISVYVFLVSKNVDYFKAMSGNMDAGAAMLSLHEDDIGRRVLT